MCDCHSSIETKLLQRFIDKQPAAKDHQARLQGYTFILSGNSLDLKGCMPIELTATFPLKKGGFKEKRIRENMIFTYCPFCGEKYSSTAEATHA